MYPWDTICYRWRTWCRLTQQEAAQAVGVPLVTWGRWERGETQPSWERQEEVIGAMMMEKMAFDYALAASRAQDRRERGE